MEDIADGLDRAEAEHFTRQPPHSAGARVRFLIARQRAANPAQAARAVAILLGIHQRTVERYRDNKITKPSPDLSQRLDTEVRRLWQPNVRRRAQQRAATTTGILVSTRAAFGYIASAGTSDEQRLRRITQPLPAEYADRLFRARQSGASEQELRDIVATGLQEHYFKAGGGRTDDLIVYFGDIDYIDFTY